MIPQAELVMLDTNVLVAYIRANALGRHIEQSYKLMTRKEKPIICVVTVGEILALAHKFGWGQEKRAAMFALLNELVVVDINIEEVLTQYAEISHFLKSSKPAKTIPQNDMWIAAVASMAGAHLITTDTDFKLLERQLKLVWIDEKVVAP